MELPMPTRPTSPDPSGTTAGNNPFTTGLGASMDFFQDWLKAAGSALPNLAGAAGSGTPGLPAWSMPTMDPAELDKRIQDLKTVQFWLEQNARMIAMTIQGLEVQRMTLDTLRGMNVSMDSLRESLKARTEEAAKAFQAHEPAAPPPAPAPSPQAASPQMPAQGGWPQKPAPAAPDVATNPDEDAPVERAHGEQPTPTSTEATGSDLINPMRWWDTLTQQFTHLASQAATGLSPGSPPAEGEQPSPQAAKANAPASTSKRASATRKSASKATPAGKKAPAKAPPPGKTRSGR
jgi:hypothetical protein